MDPRVRGDDVERLRAKIPRSAPTRYPTTTNSSFLLPAFVIFSIRRASTDQ